jgi:hypothetical protein
MVTSWTRSRRKRGRKDQIVPQAVAECFGADKPADMPKRLPSWFRVTFCRIPLRSKLEIVAGTSSFFIPLFGAFIFMLCSVYKETVLGLSSSWIEVRRSRFALDVENQRSEISPRPRHLQRVARLLLLASTLAFLGCIGDFRIIIAGGISHGEVRKVIHIG